MDNNDVNLKNMLNKFKNELSNENPDFETHYNLGLAFKDLEFIDEALEEFNVSLKALNGNKQCKEYFHCYKNIGDCFVKLQNYQESLKYYLQIINCSYFNEEEKLELKEIISNVYKIIGKFDNAIKYSMFPYGEN